MKKQIKCAECNCVTEIDFYCDTCGDNLRTKTLGIPITVEFSYGSPLDGNEYHFCSYQCLLQFIVEELKKEK